MTSDHGTDDGRAATLGQQAEALFKEAKALADQNVSRLVATLESAIRQANEIAEGGSLYPVAVRDACRKLGEQAAVRARAVDAAARLEQPRPAAGLEEGTLAQDDQSLIQADGLGPFPSEDQAPVSWREPAEVVGTSERRGAPQTEAPVEPHEVGPSGPSSAVPPEPAAPTAAANGDAGAAERLQQVPWMWEPPKPPGLFSFLRGRRRELDFEEAPPAKLPR